MTVYPRSDSDPKPSIVPGNIYLPVRDMVLGDWTDVTHENLVFEVHDEFQDIILVLENHSNQWKSGLAVHSVHLEIV